MPSKIAAKIMCVKRSSPEYMAVGRSSNQFHIINLVVDEKSLRLWSKKNPGIKDLVNELTRTNEDINEVPLNRFYYGPINNSVFGCNISKMLYDSQYNQVITLTKNGVVQIWKLNAEAAGTPPQLLITSIMSIAVSCDGTIATGSVDDSVATWSPKGIWQFPLVPEHTIENVGFSDGGRFVLSTGEGKITVGDMTGLIIYSCNFEDDVFSFSETNPTLAFKTCNSFR